MTGGEGQNGARRCPVGAGHDAGRQRPGPLQDPGAKLGARALDHSYVSLGAFGTGQEDAPAVVVLEVHHQKEL